MDQQTVVVAFGGASPEHEVSVITAHQAMAVLEESTYHIKPLYITKSGRWLTGNYLLDLKHFEDLKAVEKQSNACIFGFNKIGVPVIKEEKMNLGFIPAAKETPVYAVLNAFHGAAGENGAFQGVCETFRIPCTGSGVLGSSIGMDKVMAKDVCKSRSIPVVPGINFREDEWIENREAIRKKTGELGYPIIVKPVSLGSSIGVAKAADEKELTDVVETAFRYDHHLLAEKLIHPLMEINCSVLGSGNQFETSVCERPVGKEELLTFTDKYMSEEGGSKGMASADREIPANIPDELSEKIRNLSIEISKALRCSGLARLDFLVHAENHKIYFNEINTIPGSFSFYLWKESGLSFKELLKKIIDIAVKEQQDKTRLIQTYETNLLSTKAVKGIKGLKNQNK